MHHKAIINDDIPGAEFPMVQIANWGSGEIIDVPMSVMLKYTNHTAKPGWCFLLLLIIAQRAAQSLTPAGAEPRKDWACSLLEMAIAHLKSGKGPQDLLALVGNTLVNPPPWPRPSKLGGSPDTYPQVQE